MDDPRLCEKVTKFDFFICFCDFILWRFPTMDEFIVNLVDLSNFWRLNFSFVRRYAMFDPNMAKDHTAWSVFSIFSMAKRDLLSATSKNSTHTWRRLSPIPPAVIPKPGTQVAPRPTSTEQRPSDDVIRDHIWKGRSCHGRDGGRG